MHSAKNFVRKLKWIFQLSTLVNDVLTQFSQNSSTRAVLRKKTALYMALCSYLFPATLAAGGCSGTKFRGLLLANTDGAPMGAESYEQGGDMKAECQSNFIYSADSTAMMWFTTPQDQCFYVPGKIGSIGALDFLSINPDAVCVIGKFVSRQLGNNFEQLLLQSALLSSILSILESFLA